MFSIVGIVGWNLYFSMQEAPQRIVNSWRTLDRDRRGGAVFGEYTSTFITIGIVLIVLAGAFLIAKYALGVFGGDVNKVANDGNSAISQLG